jgi:pyruvate/2-oxoglutarate dehydrogenase complex dihydrolipoamide acyltransferase (E2) component
MLTPVTIPNVGAAGLPLRVSAWFVEPGDEIDAGEQLVEVLLSGVTCDITSPVSGRLARIERDLDAEISEGDVVAWIDTG